ncbi:MAG: recombination regulator RecX [Schleiferiaceae bacterium]|nr:recombination regulator RecX [Schleiferiaceae bacterium]
MSKKPVTLDEARAILENYCNYQPRSQEQVVRKLHQMGLIPEAVDELLIEAIQKKWVNESFFASQYVQGKFRQKKWGRLKIKEGLKKQGVVEPILSEVLNGIDTDAYWQTAKELAEKKWPTLKARSPFEQKQKLLRYLASKGFEHAIIYELADEMAKDEGTILPQ